VPNIELGIALSRHCAATAQKMIKNYKKNRSFSKGIYTSLERLSIKIHPNDSDLGDPALM